MTKLVRLVALSAAGVIAAACSKEPSRVKAPGAKLDLPLANIRSGAIHLSPDEVSSPARTLVRVPTAPVPRAQAAPSGGLIREAPAALTLGALPDLQTTGAVRQTASATIPEPIAARFPVPQAPASDSESHHSGWTPTPDGVPRGVVIRGGGVGDDHCDPHPRGGILGGLGGIFGGGIFRGGGGLGSGRTLP